MSSNPAVSVITPVYNVEKWLYRCADSLMAQTLADFEVILIDDGSTDNSGKLCDEIAQKDQRFHVIHQQNKGVSLARKIGLENSHGDYVIHCDPDDWVEPNMLEEMVKLARDANVDVVLCDMFNNESGGAERIISFNPGNDLSNIAIFQYLMKWHWCLLNKLIRRDCYLKYNVVFPDYLQFAEDAVILLSLYQNPVSTAYLPKPFYHYFINNVSSLTSIDPSTHYEKTQKAYHILSEVLVSPYREQCLQVLELHQAQASLSYHHLFEKNFRKAYPLLKAHFLRSDYSVNTKALLFIAFFVSPSLAAQLYKLKLRHGRQ